MIYHAGDMVFSSIREVFCGRENDVLICRDINSPTGKCYTLLVIKDRSCAKKLLSIFEKNEKSLPEGVTPYILNFTQNDMLCFVFDYRQERRLSAFVKGQMTSSYTKERICINLLMECLSNPLPYPLLFLVLTQGNIHIEKDNTVYFTPFFDLSELNEAKDESSCAKVCAELLLGMLQGNSRKQLKSYELITKKVARNAYQSIPALYMDIKITAIAEKGQKFPARVKKLWNNNKDRLFRVLLFLCVAAVIIALVCLLSQLIFGDIPFLRLFEHSFDVIGTQTLK